MGIFGNLFKKKSLQSVQPTSTWTSLFVSEPYSGAWQKNDELKLEDNAAFYAVFACVSLIAKDIGKMPLLLKKRQQGVLVEAAIPKPLQRVWERPNNYQNWQQFNEQWTTSLLLRGNTYALKQRDVFGEVYRLVVLNPDRVKPLVSDLGEVFYQLEVDRLTQAESTIVPASEIIHDRINTFYHPLVGLTPITACALASRQGLAIMNNSASFFGNGSKPRGVLTALGAIDAEKARIIREQWNAAYSGQNYGKTAVIGDGMKYESVTMTANDSQLIEQLGMSARIVCTAFNVPPFKIGITDVQATTKIADLNEIYYSDCLQAYIESRENLIDDGLQVKTYGVETFLDLDALIRMDSQSKVAYYKEGISAGIFAPNEARQKMGYLPVEGGDSPMIQQQNYSLAALARRDAQADPFNTQASQNQPENNQNQAKNTEKQPILTTYKGVFDAEQAYQIGDFVTKNGSLWHCDQSCKGDFDYQNWTLAVKKGEADALRNA